MFVPLLALLVSAAEPERAGRPLSAWAGDLGSSSTLVREEALEVLAQFGVEGKPALDAIRPLLKAPQVKTRLRAAFALWKIEGKSDALFPVLVEAAREQRRELRILVLDIVQKLGPLEGQASAALVECLADSDIMVGTPAQQALLRLGTSALPALTAGLKHKDDTVKRQVLGLLAGLGPRAGSAAPAVLDLAKHPDAAVRRQALNFLFIVRPTPREAIPLFEAALKEEEMLLRLQAAGALWDADRRVKDVLPVLVEALKERKDITVRQQASAVLGRMGPAAKEVVPALIELARGESSGEMAREVGAVFGRMKPLPAEQLETLLTDREARLRELAFVALRGAAPTGEAAVAALARALPRVPEREQINICSALGMTVPSARAGVPALVAALKGKDANVAAAAARALEQIGPWAEAALPAALDILKDEKQPLAFRAQASVILGRIGPPAKAAVPALIELLRKRELTYRQRNELIQAFGTIGPPAGEALPVLVELSKSGPVIVRAVALESIWSIDPGHPAVVPGFVSLLRADKQRGAPHLLQFLPVLGRCGDEARPAVPLLIEGLKQAGQVRLRTNYVRAIGQIGPAAREAVPVLREQLAEKEVDYRAEVAVALARLGAIDEDVLAALGASVRGGNIYARMIALQTLNDLGPQGRSVAGAVLQAWRVEHLPYNRIPLAETAALLDPKTAREMIPWLREQASLPTSMEGPWAAAVLWAIEPEAKEVLPMLLRTLRDEKAPPETAYRRVVAAEALARIGPPAREAVPDLLAAINAAPDPKTTAEEKATQEFQTISLRLAAAAALWRVDPKHRDKALATFRTLLREEGHNGFPYRGQPVLVISQLRSDAAEAVPVLVEAFPASEQQVRLRIFDAVRKIDPKALARLRPESRK
jgi:hypothetical protein